MSRLAEGIRLTFLALTPVVAPESCEWRTHTKWHVSVRVRNLNSTRQSADEFEEDKVEFDEFEGDCEALLYSSNSSDGCQGQF